MSWYSRSERKGADLTGSRLHFNSGRGFEKFDYSSEEYLTDHKATRNRFYELRPVVWNSIGKAAYRQGKKPRMILDFRLAPGLQSVLEITGPHYVKHGCRVYADGRCTGSEFRVRVLRTGV